MTRVGYLFVSLFNFHVKLSSQCPSSTHPPQNIRDTLPEANTALRRPWRSRAMSVPRQGHHSRPTLSIATLMSSKASQNNQWNSSTLHPALLKGQRYTSPWNSWTNAFHSYWAPKTKTWYCPHKLCIQAYWIHVRPHLTNVDFEYAIHCAFNKKIECIRINDFEYVLRPASPHSLTWCNPPGHEPRPWCLPHPLWYWVETETLGQKPPSSL